MLIDLLSNTSNGPTTILKNHISIQLNIFFYLKNKIVKKIMNLTNVNLISFIVYSSVYILKTYGLLIKKNTAHFF